MKVQILLDLDLTIRSRPCETLDLNQTNSTNVEIGF